ncbi:hypothetical protein jhhlp_003531 [Lomentospora prolificans]|uniref:Casein kinase substrate phosphoprotein PP28 domain-containing protein n=1 Tax=Lomentospora prolificans TaxID=41688 RepID=A0A2N3N901_9PEZI|nr:hypothetical protein jhhlp_003531 [Lomentospora prolificans]
MSTARQKKDVASSLSNLSLGTSKATKPKSKTNVVADSWEDEALSSGSEGEETGGNSQNNASLPSAPPPTPITTSHNKTDTAYVPDFASGNYVPMSPGAPDGRRPEKTDAVARRMIAGALGMRAPKQTEEQKAYDRAIKEQARKKKEEEREAERRRQEEAEKAKAAMWGE